MIELLEANRDIFLAIHLLGTVYALGGATVTDIMFFRFMRNYHITSWEQDTIQVLSKVIWIGIGLLVLSGLALYLPDAAAYNESPLFLAKMSVVVVVFINGALLNFWLEPEMTRISFIEQDEEKDKAVATIRHIAFILGAVSFVSWYGAFLLAVMEAIPLSYLGIMSVYLALLLTSIGMSQIVERYFEVTAPKNEAEL